MPAPRRHRRRLLLPVGWLALGFLLWLSGLWLTAQPRLLKLPNVMQLSFPALAPLKADEPNWSLRWARQQTRQVPYWTSLRFTGRPGADSLTAARRLGPALGSLCASLQKRRGLVIYFDARTRYRYLVASLDSINQRDVKRYFLDYYQRPYALYIFGPNCRLNYR